jgi:copper(I)-binding protein
MDGSGAVGVVYLTLINEGPAADRLIGAQTDVAATVELHQTTLNNGIAHMQPVSGIDVPAGGRVAIQPGGYHLMLIGLKRALKIGDRFEIALQFQKSGQLIVEVEVRQP